MAEVKNQKCIDALIRAEENVILADEYLRASVVRYCRIPCYDTAATVTKAKRLWWLAQVNRNFN